MVQNPTFLWNTATNTPAYSAAPIRNGTQCPGCATIPRATMMRRLAELEADIAQTQPLVALAGQLHTRRPLPQMRGFAIAPDFALYLTELIDDERPEVVVETGSGVSTLIIAYALEKLGR